MAKGNGSKKPNVVESEDYKPQDIYRFMHAHNAEDERQVTMYRKDVEIIALVLAKVIGTRDETIEQLAGEYESLRDGKVDLPSDAVGRFAWALNICAFSSIAIALMHGRAI